MFKKVQIRLTAFTLLSLIIFLTAFSVVSIFQTRSQISNGASRGLEMVHEKINSTDLSELERRSRELGINEFALDDDFGDNFGRDFNRKPNFIFLNNVDVFIMDLDNNVIQQTDDSIQLSSDLNDSFDQLLATNQKIFFSATIDDADYWVLTDFKIIDQELYILHVLSNKHIENELFFIFIRGLVILWVGSIIVLGLISWFISNIALKPAKQSWEQQKRLIADVSHELKTPLTVVKANLDIPLADPSDTVQENIQWINNAYEETEHMTNLVNDLLTFSRIDAGQEQIEHELVNISNVIAMACNKMRLLFESKSLEFNDAIDQNMEIYGDASRLTQLIKILLDNAFKYTEAGHVTVSAYKKHQNIIIEVADSGIGISSDDLPHIFDRFYKADASRVKTGSSSGLGLSIAEWIVKEHHGKINVESDVNVGTKFIVQLPC